MRALIRHALRQQRIAYLVICFMLFALATALGKQYGWGTTLALWAGSVAILEFGYRRLLSFEARNRRKWWARPHRRGRRIRFYVYYASITLCVLIYSPFTRYALLALLTAGLICAGIIHVLHRREEL